MNVGVHCRLQSVSLQGCCCNSWMQLDQLTIWKPTAVEAGSEQSFWGSWGEGSFQGEGPCVLSWLWLGLRGQRALLILTFSAVSSGGGQKDAGQISAFLKVSAYAVSLFPSLYMLHQQLWRNMKLSWLFYLFVIWSFYLSIHSSASSFSSYSHRLIFFRQCINDFVMDATASTL